MICVSVWFVQEYKKLNSKENEDWTFCTPTSDGDFNNTTKRTNFTEMEHKSMDMSEKQRFHRS